MLRHLINFGTVGRPKILSMPNLTGGGGCEGEAEKGQRIQRTGQEEQERGGEEGARGQGRGLHEGRQ